MGRTSLATLWMSRRPTSFCSPVGRAYAMIFALIATGHFHGQKPVGHSRPPTMGLARSNAACRPALGDAERVLHDEGYGRYQSCDAARR